MAANIDQIFQEFILNKIREIEVQNEDKTYVTTVFRRWYFCFRMWITLIQLEYITGKIWQCTLLPLWLNDASHKLILALYLYVSALQETNNLDYKRFLTDDSVAVASNVLMKIVIHRSFLYEVNLRNNYS